MNSAQLSTLRADILASFPLVPMNDDGHLQIALAYNQLAVPDYWVWRTNVTKGEYVQTTSADGTTFNWTGTGFVTRSIGERDAWREVFNSEGMCNPSLGNVRQAFRDIFSGSTEPAPANRTHLLAISRRLATRAEKLFAVGLGTAAAPSTMTFEGNVRYSDISEARSL